MLRQFRIAAVLRSPLLAAAGCGIKGPLVLPPPRTPPRAGAACRAAPPPVAPGTACADAAATPNPRGRPSASRERFRLSRRRALRRARAAVGDRRAASARRATSTRAPRSRPRGASSTRRSPASPHLVCYAMKANSNLAVLDLFARLGSGFDIVSGGELARVLAAGGDPAKVVFSGVGKTEAEMAAALAAGILCFNVESAAELDAPRRRRRPRWARVAPVSFRVNPDVDPKTHPYISTGLKESKFGIAFADAPALYRRAARAAEHRRPRYRHPHRLADHRARRRTARPRSKVLELVDRPGAPTASRSRTSTWAAASAFATATRRRSPLADYAAMIARRSSRGRRETAAVRAGPPSGRRRRRAADARRIPEAGRARKNFAIVDAAMNDLLRPALYDAWHPVDAGAAARRRRARAGTSSGRCARAAIFSRTIGGWRSRPATCSPSARPARTGWR